MKVLSVVGARPQFVKLAPMARAFHARGVDHVIVHTGQHYDPMLSDVFFQDLGIPAPDHHLGVGSGSHGVQTGAILAALDDVLLAEHPDWVLVYGDTNSTLAAALSAVKLHLPVAHLEAGLRSFNRAMPEEHNRVLTDHAADLLLAPTEVAAAHLAAEGLSSRTVVVGDVMTDVLYRVRDLVSGIRPGEDAGSAPVPGRVVPSAGAPAAHPETGRAAVREGRLTIPGIAVADSLEPTIPSKAGPPTGLGSVVTGSSEPATHPNTSRPAVPGPAVTGSLEPTTHPKAGPPTGSGSAVDLATELGLTPGGYSVATIHRAENTDDPARLTAIVEALQTVDHPVVLLAHPRLVAKASAAGIALDGGSLIPHEPLAYPALIAAVVRGRGVITDSGGLQKEAFLLRRPCTTVRTETEWVETVELGWNVLVEPSGIASAASRAAPPPTDAMPYGDGRAAERVVAALAAD